MDVLKEYVFASHNDLPYKADPTPVKYSGRQRRSCFLGKLRSIRVNPGSISFYNYTHGRPNFWEEPGVPRSGSFQSIESPTRKSDCYALGIVIYEVLGGKEPFSQYPVFATAVKIIKCKRPERPRSGWFPDGIWEALERCWGYQPSD